MKMAYFAKRAKQYRLDRLELADEYGQADEMKIMDRLGEVWTREEVQNLIASGGWCVSVYKAGGGGGSSVRAKEQQLEIARGQILSVAATLAAAKINNTATNGIPIQLPQDAQHCVDVAKFLLETVNHTAIRI